MTSVPRKFPTKTVIATAVALGLVAFLVVKNGVSFQEVWDSVNRFRVSVVVSAFVLVVLQNLFIVLRLWALLPAKSGLSLFEVAHGVIYGQLVNTFVPARAGDVLKAVIFKKAPNSTVSLMTGAGIIVADKFVDFGAVALLILISGAYATPELVWLPEIPPWTYAALPAVALLLFALCRFLLRDRFTALKIFWHNFRDGLHSLAKPRQVIVAVLIGLGAWTFEATALQILTSGQSMGMPIELDRAVFLLCLLNLAIAVPISLANVGAFEASLVFGLSTFGIPTATGLAIATVHHALQLGSILVLSGIVALVRLFNRRAILFERPAS